MITCRICKTDLNNSKETLTLPRCPLTDQFVKPNSENKQLIEDVKIYCCESCGFIQNPNNIDYQVYYEDYEYTSAESTHAHNFMNEYAKLANKIYMRLNNKSASKVIEPGSGDGTQLHYFKEKGCNVVGIEPSENLAKKAESRGITTIKALFDKRILEKVSSNFDICISSYTLDHCPDPLEYLLTANRLLNHNGLCIFEVHDYDKIYERSEYCLFEHEHTIYLNARKAIELSKSCGFDIVEVNPLADDKCRANSLIIVAKKVKDAGKENINVNSSKETSNQSGLNRLQSKVTKFIDRIDNWINKTEGVIVGYGAGGRGVMTLAQLSNSSRIKAILDVAFDDRVLLTPKTLIQIYGPSDFTKFKDASVIVFSYGYFKEIKSRLVEEGYKAERIISLQEFMD